MNLGSMAVKLVRTEEDWRKLDQFAKSFGHEIPDRVWPIYTFSKKDRIIGLIQLYNAPIGFTQWHTDPDVCRPVDFFEAMLLLKGYAKIGPGVGLVAVPRDSENFTPDVMEKLDLKRLNQELFQYGGGI